MKKEELDALTNSFMSLKVSADMLGASLNKSVPITRPQQPMAVVPMAAPQTVPPPVQQQTQPFQGLSDTEKFMMATALLPVALKKMEDAIKNGAELQARSLGFNVRLNDINALSNIETSKLRSKLSDVQKEVLNLRDEGLVPQKKSTTELIDKMLFTGQKVASMTKFLGETTVYFNRNAQISERIAENINNLSTLYNITAQRLFDVVNSMSEQIAAAEAYAFAGAETTQTIAAITAEFPELDKEIGVLFKSFFNPQNLQLIRSTPGGEEAYNKLIFEKGNIQEKPEQLLKLAQLVTDRLSSIAIEQPQSMNEMLANSIKMNAQQVSNDEKNAYFAFVNRKPREANQVQPDLFAGSGAPVIGKDVLNRVETNIEIRTQEALDNFTRGFNADGVRKAIDQSIETLTTGMNSLIGTLGIPIKIPVKLPAKPEDVQTSITTAEQSLQYFKTVISDALADNNILGEEREVALNAESKFSTSITDLISVLNSSNIKDDNLSQKISGLNNQLQTLSKEQVKFNSNLGFFKLFYDKLTPEGTDEFSEKLKDFPEKFKSVAPQNPTTIPFPTPISSAPVQRTIPAPQAVTPVQPTVPAPQAVTPVQPTVPAPQAVTPVQPTVPALPPMLPGMNFKNQVPTVPAPATSKVVDQANQTSWFDSQPESERERALGIVHKMIDRRSQTEEDQFEYRDAMKLFFEMKFDKKSPLHPAQQFKQIELEYERTRTTSEKYSAELEVLREHANTDPKLQYRYNQQYMPGGRSKGFEEYNAYNIGNPLEAALKQGFIDENKYKELVQSAKSLPGNRTYVDSYDSSKNSESQKVKDALYNQGRGGRTYDSSIKIPEPDEYVPKFKRFGQGKSFDTSEMSPGQKLSTTIQSMVTGARESSTSRHELESLSILKDIRDLTGKSYELKTLNDHLKSLVNVRTNTI